VQGDICSICCGNEREVTVTCPLDCPYLKEAHEHERLAKLDPRNRPNKDIDVGDEFVRTHGRLLNYMGATLAFAISQAAAQIVDADIREALDSLIRTYRTMSSGLIYSSRPTNPHAARIFSEIEAFFTKYREMMREKMQSVRDAELLKVLVFFHLMAISLDNGRPKCRRFVEALGQFEMNAAEEPTRLVEL
jgi:hypothetical protein